MTKRKTRATHAVIIGRFQPLHLGHEYLISKAYELADNVTILIGSSGGPRTPLNPWTFEERKRMVQSTFPDATCLPLYDYAYNELRWITQVQDVINELKQDGTTILVGHEKDDSTYYMNVFPNVDTVDVGFMQVLGGRCMDATRVRELIFKEEMAFVMAVVSEGTLEVIEELRKSDAGDTLIADYKYIQDYKRQFAGSPYPPTFVTADAIVVQSGHILLVQRGGHPGLHQWALPGGFIGVDERIEDAALRELIEETSIKIQPKILRKSIVSSRVFDAPHRSLRGRTITHAYLLKLDDDKPLPPVRGADDAAKAWWFPIADVPNMREKFFEDHFEITMAMIATL